MRNVSDEFVEKIEAHFLFDICLTVRHWCK